MRKLLAVAALALAAWPAPAVAQAAPPAVAPADVAGWHGTKWGMTVEEAKAALGAEAEEVSAEASTTQKWNFGKGGAWPTRLRVPTYEVSGYVFDVKLAFEADRLRLVALVPAQKNLPGLAGVFSGLESQLVEKYGAPTMRKKQFSQRQILWTLNKTVIDLSFYDFGMGKDNVLIWTYTPRPADDKL